MDNEFMKSSAEDQIEMMLMQMGYSDDHVDEMNPIMEFNNHIPNNTNIYQTQNDHVNSPTFINLNPSTISFSNRVHDYEHPNLHHHHNSSGGAWGTDEYSAASPSQKRNSMAAMREMIFRIAAMQPIHIDPETVKPPKRKNVKISSDPQSVAARHRRERISERIRILQRLVPGGTKMDTASMLDEAIHYVKFLKNQVQSLERVAANRPAAAAGIGFPVPMTSGSYFPAAAKGYHHNSMGHNVQYLADA